MPFLGMGRATDPGDEQPDAVPEEPNGHLLSQRRDKERRRDETYRAMRSTADEVMRRLTGEARRQADLDRIRREATDSGDAA